MTQIPLNTQAPNHTTIVTLTTIAQPQQEDVPPTDTIPGPTSNHQEAVNLSPQMVRWIQQNPREGTPSEYLGINSQQNKQR